MVWFFFRLENHQAQWVWRKPCSVVTLLRITFISCHVLVQQKSPPRRQTPDLSLSKHGIIKTSVSLHDQNSLNQVENLVMCNFWTLMEQCFTFQKMLRLGILPEKKVVHESSSFTNQIIFHSIFNEFKKYLGDRTRNHRLHEKER